MNNNSSWQHYWSVKQANPGMFPWQLAKKLGVTEAEMREVCIRHGARRLVCNPMKLLTELAQVGEVMAITDNGSSVNEIVGNYENARISDSTGLFLNPGGLDLRLFPRRWLHVFALEEEQEKGGLWQSIQFYDEAGEAVHRVYATDNTDRDKWQQLVKQYADDNAPAISIKPRPPVVGAAEETPTPEKVEQYWRDIVDVHQFPGLLKKFGLTRQQAFALVSDELARKVSTSSVKTLLEKVHQGGNKMMVFTMSQGCVQIYTGPVQSVGERGHWLNVKGERFSFHLRKEDVAECWVVKKPTGDGFVTSLEMYHANGDQIGQFYGSRREGQAEQALWHEQVNSLE